MQFDLDPAKLASAIGRLRAGEHPRAVATELGMTVPMLSALRRDLDKRTRPASEALRPLVAQLGEEQGFAVKLKASFTFPEVGFPKSYNPDCVWFDGAVADENTLAIFEIDAGVSPKHRAGGVAFANLVALKLSKRLLFFAIAPPENKRVASATIEVHRKYLGDKWCLDSAVIASFEPQVIRDRVCSVLAARHPSPRQ
jgi:hypothetical protein